MRGKSKYLRAHKEPDADDYGGPRDYDADDPPARRTKADTVNKRRIRSKHARKKN